MKRYDYKLVGLKRVMRNLNRELKQIEGKTFIGMWVVGKKIEGKSKRLCPVGATGNLIGSWYADISDTPDGLSLVMGYSADYALHVHEHDRHYRKPGSQWKFLEAPLYESTGEIVSILQRMAKV